MPILAYVSMCPLLAMSLAAAEGALCLFLVHMRRRRTGHQKHERGRGRGLWRGGGGGGRGGDRGGPAMVVALTLGSQGGLSLGKP